MPAMYVELVELASRRKAMKMSEGQRITFYCELRAVERERGYKPGWSAHQYKTKFDYFPPWSWNNFPTLIPSAATLSWVRSRQIAFAKRRA